jgi:hypothetical protein
MFLDNMINRKFIQKPKELKVSMLPCRQRHQHPSQKFIPISNIKRLSIAFQRKKTSWM